MFLISKIEPIIQIISVLAILVIVLSIILRKMNQTYIIGYILAGILLGEQGLAVVDDKESVELLGELGVILLLFFIGMEINLIDFLKRWKLAVLGTLLQIILSVLLVFFIGSFYDWSLARSVVLGFVIALSSSAVVIKLLQDKHLIDTRIGKNVLSILLAQDIVFVPLLIIISQLGGKAESTESIVLMIIGAIVIVATLVYIYIKGVIVLPYSKKIYRDHELQVFMAIFLCFGGALATSFFGISPALGAFVGGMIINAAKATDWIHDTLHSFRVLFVSLFFISVGLQIDLGFVYNNLWTIFSVIFVVYITNHLLNTVILKVFSNTWKEAFLGGALLAQIGELSFLISSTALGLGIIEEFSYNFTISLISLTLIISPFWIGLSEKLINRKKNNE
ncbi:cation:proton antiporter [Aquimarina sp. BL5]|uniref:cation:proton antiporter n=1 Tax=Aquimarina sp. BL5 TaxID=1714860 RepID=UPI000E4C4653|nr:cation:proton antiporter [Aquimarina sp. BL5]AXT53087.1 cation:proton antiporter [Aquimarina sp. BL5]RKN03174.1 cation:proton antiporter [Aquimarina sp. BL5]